jgi:hypothetical protein
MGTLPNDSAVIVGANSYNAGVSLGEDFSKRGFTRPRRSDKHPYYFTLVHICPKTFFRSVAETLFFRPHTAISFHLL